MFFKEAKPESQAKNIDQIGSVFNFSDNVAKSGCKSSNKYALIGHFVVLPGHANDKELLFRPLQAMISR
jgi:hypothetical protein